MTLHQIQTRPVRTLNDFRLRVNTMTDEYQLTATGKELVRGYEWSFSGDAYRRAWGYLFTRARTLGLTYCKQFKRFIPLPHPDQPLATG